jgi:S1-C subfamily serine protease
MPDTPPSPLETISAALADIVAAAAPSVVFVHSTRSRSSGFAWRPNLVVTADEALAEEGEVVLTAAGGERHPATIVGRDAATDIALLRVEGARLSSVSFGAPAVRAGGLVLAVGGGALAFSGIVAIAGPSWHSMRGGEIDARIELDLRLRRQAEGGLALDAGGRAFGMTVFGPRRRTLVIPAPTIDRVAARLERDGRIPRGYLGLGLQPVRVESDGASGAMVVSLDNNGPGAAAGLHQGDVIVSWDGQKLSGVGALLRALGPDSVGRTVALGLRRGGTPLELTLTIGERPEA